MNEESLFAAALELPDPARRRAFLDAACAGDDRLRERLEQLMAADEDGSCLLDRTEDAAAVMGAYRPQPPLAADRVFAGRFRLLRKLGEGGMGEVWVADQLEPVRRRVALKVIRTGLGTAQKVARFEQERQALALMDHPNIGKVHDAGVESGRPFFVMELIDGPPITRYCDEARLTLRQRLELFIEVCSAVQHAHQKGVIHRDLKPSNILVALYDGKPAPKVIDFGVAKMTGPRLGLEGATTEVGTVLGTVEYMSPEQADAGDRDIDTRSDVYALGALLYELLTGAVPFPGQRLQALPVSERLRVIKDEEPPAPSARLAATEGLTAVAAARRAEPRRLISQVRGELDWIAMRCLEKDPTRRYETANGLARDVQRYLADEPVHAGPPSAGYRVRKFLRRHRGPALAAGLVLLALVGGVVGTTIGLVRAVRARQTAQKRLDQVQIGIDALSSIFKDLDPNAEQKEGKPLRAILAERLDGAAAALEGEAVGDPLLVAALQDRLGQTYLGLGQAAKAEALFRKALATCRDHLGEDHLTTLARMENLALAYRHAGKWNEAIALFQDLRDAKAEKLGADDPSTLSTLNNLATTYWVVGRLPEAIPLLEKVRDADVKRYGADDPRTLNTLNNLAGAYAGDGRYTEGIALQEEVLDAQVKKHGEGHPSSIGAMNNLANSYRDRFRMRKAFDLFKRARGAALSSLGPLHPETLRVLDNLAHTYRMDGNPDEAIALGEEVRGKRLIVLGPYHPDTLTTMDELGLAYQQTGQFDKALPLFQQAATGVEKLEHMHSAAASMIDNLCRCHEQREEFAQAEAWRRKLLAVVKAKDGAGSLAYARQLGRLGSNLLQQNRHAAAEPLLRESLAVFQKLEPGEGGTSLTQPRLGADPGRVGSGGVREWQTFLTRARLGAALLGQKKYAAAEPHLVQACAGMARWAERLGPSHAGSTSKPLAESLEHLVQLYDALGKPDQAAKYRKELEALQP